jgi:dipeptidyl aminopeptidase/acylaminoacyl peptidase
MLIVDNEIITSIREVNFDFDFLNKSDSDINPKVAEEALSNCDKIKVYNFKYKSNGSDISGIFALPNQFSEQKLPVIINNRGGNRNLGAWKKFSPYTGYTAALVKSGYAVLMSQYSGGPNSGGQDDFGGKNIEDILIFKKIIEQNPFLDVNRIGMLGHSRGGMMTYRSIASVDWIKAAVSIAGMTNLKRNLERSESHKADLGELFDVENPLELELRSALCWPEKFCETSPLLMIHGTADWRVSPLDSLELATELYRHKKPYRLIMLEGGDHFLSEYRKLLINNIVSWFEIYLKSDANLPNLEPHGA